jgi:hypothetical protein
MSGESSFVYQLAPAIPDRAAPFEPLVLLGYGLATPIKCWM